MYMQVSIQEKLIYDDIKASIWGVGAECAQNLQAQIWLLLDSNSAETKSLIDRFKTW